MYSDLRKKMIELHVAHLLQAVYQERALALARALEEECGNRVVVRMPSGGMFLWVEVPFVDDTEELLDLMVAQKVCVSLYFAQRP